MRSILTPRKRKIDSSSLAPSKRRRTTDKNVHRQKNAPVYIRPGVHKTLDNFTRTTVVGNGATVSAEKNRFPIAGPQDLGNFTIAQEAQAIGESDCAEVQSIGSFNNRLVIYLIPRYLYIVHHGPDKEQLVRVMTEKDLKLFKLITPRQLPWKEFKRGLGMSILARASIRHQSISVRTDLYGITLRIYDITPVINSNNYFL